MKYAHPRELDVAIRQDGRQARAAFVGLNGNPFYLAENADLDLDDWLIRVQAWAAGWRDEDGHRDGADRQ